MTDAVLGHFLYGNAKLVPYFTRRCSLFLPLSFTSCETFPCIFRSCSCQIHARLCLSERQYLLVACLIPPLPLLFLHNKRPRGLFVRRVCFFVLEPWAMV
ncbi:hypothetical protein B5F76_01070 [Desulfovibrio sp. An276]|nr:hypothetical protein B5F76_01070 [Desulfovibrio sp. An276]